MAGLQQNTRKIEDLTQESDQIMPILWVGNANRRLLVYSQTCRKCGQKNHFHSNCLTTTLHVNTVEQVTEEVFGSGSRAMITMEVGEPSSQSHVTGSECNILSLKDYRRVTLDVDLKPTNRCTHVSKNLHKCTVQDKMEP